MNKHEAARLHLLIMSSRYRRMSESVQHDKQWSPFKEYPNSGAEKKNEEIISSSCLPHHKRDSSFTNKHEAARLHLLPMLSRYRRMSESVHHDEECSSFHDRWCFRYDEQCSSFHAEGLTFRHIKKLRGGWYPAIVVARVSDHLSQSTCLEVLHPKTDEHVNPSVEVHRLVGNYPRLKLF